MKKRGEGELVLLFVLELGVEDGGDERRRGPASSPGPGLCVGLELVRGAATDGRAALDVWALSAGVDVHV